MQYFLYSTSSALRLTSNSISLLLCLGLIDAFQLFLATRLPYSIQGTAECFYTAQAGSIATQENSTKKYTLFSSSNRVQRQASCLETLRAAAQQQEAQEHAVQM